MSVICDTTIRQRLHRGQLIASYPEWMAEVHPDGRPVHVGPASLDLHVGRTFRQMTPMFAFDNGELVAPQYDVISYALLKSGEVDDVVWEAERDVAPGDHLTIMPGEFWLAETAERVLLPDDLAAQVSARSTYGRMGLQVCGDAGFIDPGFGDKTPEQVEATGHRGTTITLELHNCGARPIRIEPGERICQLIIWRLDRPAEQPYGSKAGSQYQTQQGPTAPGGR